VAPSMTWRERVTAAKKHAAATLSIARLLQYDHIRGRAYYDIVPPAGTYARILLSSTCAVLVTETPL